MMIKKKVPMTAACGANDSKKNTVHGVWSTEKHKQGIYGEMGRQPLVSVLIAVHEPKMDWFRQQLRSIHRQTYQNFEVLIIDDASGHTSFQKIQRAVFSEFCREALINRQEAALEGLCGSICKDKQKGMPAAAHISKIYLWRNSDNEGSNRTFEKLAGLAHGEYVAFCDQDDIWERDKLEQLLHAIRQGHAVMAYSDMSVIDEKGAVCCKSLKNLRRGVKFVHGANLTAYYLADNCSAGCSMLIRSDVLRKAVPFSRETYCDQWVAACASAYGRVSFVPKPLVRYRRHGSNQTESLAKINSRQDYYEKRVLPMYRLVMEMKARGIHYKYEKEMIAFARARRQRKPSGIWKYRRWSRKYAYFDLLMLCMPQAAARVMLALLKKDRHGFRPLFIRGRLLNKKIRGKETKYEDTVSGAHLFR